MKRPERLHHSTLAPTTNSDFDHLLSWIDLVAHTWLPRVDKHTLTLKEALAAATPAWTDQTPTTTDVSPTLLFPLAYHGTAQLTAGLFHQLVDACCEAQRANGTVILTAIPVGRCDMSQGAARTVDSIAQLFRDECWKIDSAGDLPSLNGLGRHLAARARTTTFTRRATDLPDMLTAAAADAIGADRVYLADGIVAGRHLHRLSCTAPLGRLHTPGKPFAGPPPMAKRVPAGFDQLWSAALTLGITEKVGLGLHRHEHLQAEVKSRLGTLWKKLMTAGLTRHYGPSSEEPRRISLSGPPRDRMVIPLFGAPRVSAATDALVSAASAISPTTLVVDDVTPRVFYTGYPAERIHDAYRALAMAHRCAVTFLSDIDAADLSTRLHAMLEFLTIGDLVEATPPGRSNRSRGSFTGYDAIHLATMAVACTIHADACLAAQAHNVPALKAITRRCGDTALLARSGPPGPLSDHELRLDFDWFSKTFRGTP